MGTTWIYLWDNSYNTYAKWIALLSMVLFRGNHKNIFFYCLCISLLTLLSTNFGQLLPVFNNLISKDTLNFSHIFLLVTSNAMYYFSGILVPFFATSTIVVPLYYLRFIFVGSVRWKFVAFITHGLSLHFNIRMTISSYLKCGNHFFSFLL